MNRELFAPQIGHYLHCLDHDYNLYNCSFSYDEKTYALLDEIFAELKKIKPIDEMGMRSLWLHVARGPIEAYGDCQEAIEEGVVDNAQEFQDDWEYEYPDEEYWYSFSAYEDESGYKQVFIGHRFIFCVKPEQAHYFPFDASEFAQWLLDYIRKTIRELQAGTYNDYVNAHLPAEHRTGTIIRNDLYRVVPEYKTSFLEDFTMEETRQFLSYAENEQNESNVIPAMTANTFYTLCAIGYRANHYKGADESPKDQYLMHADGRDEGLREIDPDSTEAFHAWLTDKRNHGGHPFEVCRGGNSTHISLFVSWSEEGYRLILSGSAVGRTIETIRFYLALREAGYKPKLTDMEHLAGRLKGTEKIGIVPSGVFPRYCSPLFPDEHIIDFMNLPFEGRDEIAKKCVWQPIKPVELMHYE